MSGGVWLMCSGVWVLTGGDRWCLGGVWGVSGGCLGVSGWCLGSVWTFWWCLGGVGWCLDGVKDTFTNPGTLCPPPRVIQESRTPCLIGLRKVMSDVGIKYHDTSCPVKTLQLVYLFSEEKLTNWD